MGSSSDHTKKVLALLVPPHPSAMQKTLLLVLLVAFVASSSAFHFGLGGIGYGLGYGYGYPYAMGGIGGFILLLEHMVLEAMVLATVLATASEDTTCLERVTTRHLQPYISPLLNNIG